MTDQQTYADLGAAAWRWVLDQVRWDDGPWIPVSVPHEGGPPEERDGMHSGIGGLAHVLAEIRQSRDWTDEEAALADGIAVRIREGLPMQPLATYFDGAVSDLGVRKGFMLTYGLEEMPTPKELLQYGERWRPYRSVAAWYMWRAADQAKDPTSTRKPARV